MCALWCCNLWIELRIENEQFAISVHVFIRVCLLIVSVQVKYHEWKLIVKEKIIFTHTHRMESTVFSVLSPRRSYSLTFESWKEKKQRCVALAICEVLAAQFHEYVESNDAKILMYIPKNTCQSNCTGCVFTTEKRTWLLWGSVCKSARTHTHTHKNMPNLSENRMNQMKSSKK